MDYSRRHFVRTLFVASQATLLGRLVPTHLYGDESAPAALNFVVIGDWGRQGRPDQKQVADQMALAARDSGAKFVISVGDNFYENGVKSIDDDHWQKSFEEVYAAPSLQVPWYTILGNHDYHGNCDIQIEYGKTHPRWVMPARYYNKVQQIDASSTVEFFYIDTSPMVKAYLKTEHPEHPDLRDHVISQDVPAQLQWFERALAASHADWKIVIGHHPVYSGGGAHGDQPELIERVLPLLHKYKVAAYFCGHDHDLQHLKEGAVNFFVSGGGSEHRPDHETPRTQFVRPSSGFMAVSLTKEKMQVRLIDNLGSLLYTTTVPDLGSAVNSG